jgi:outer membrane receptor for ferrienterochelin and colicin
MYKFTKNYIAIAIALAIMAPQALAENTQQANEIKKDNPVEVIEVRSGKRIKLLNEIAASVSVIGGEQLEKINVSDFSDLSSRLPNVSILKQQFSVNDVFPR